MENVKNASEFFRGNKCIWMDANVVAYKLCNQKFDCDRCSFDFVMRNTWKEQAEADQIIPHLASNSLIDKMIRNISIINVNEKYMLIKNQLLLKHMFGSVYTMAISQLLQTILENIDEIKLLHDYGYVKKEEPILSLNGKWGSKVIVAPMDFTILQKLDIDPDDLPDDSWFAVISVKEAELTLVKHSINKFRDERRRLITNLNKYMKLAPEIGATMMDGGNKCNYLFEYLGLEEFDRIVSNLL